MIRRPPRPNFCPYAAVYRLGGINATQRQVIVKRQADVGRFPQHTHDHVVHARDESGGVDGAAIQPLLARERQKLLGQRGGTLDRALRAFNVAGKTAGSASGFSLVIAMPSR